MATAGHDYLVRTGFKWANPERITYSIAPDGVDWISGKNVLNATFDAKFGKGVWEREIARALATWQSVANINIVPVSDGPYRVNALGAAQGDARFGDIRIGGDPIASNKTTLAQTYFPPPQGSTAGGDVELNLNLSFGIGKDFDLYSIILHETGHSLGLDHPPNEQEVMRPSYGGVVTTLQPGDIAGIQSIYGARRLDIYQSQGYGLNAALPIELSSVLATSQVSTSEGASLTKIGDVEWFSFIAPSYASGSWQVTASASNSSMLSPKVMVYDAGGALLAQAGDASKWAADATASVSSIVPGRRYYAAVTGATKDVFAVGAYSLIVSMSKAPSTPPPVTVPPPVTIPTPVVPPPTVNPVVPVTPTPPPTGPLYPTTVVVAPDRFEVNNSIASATRLGRVLQTSVGGLTLPTADVDYYSFQAGAAGVFQISAGGAVIQVLNNQGRVMAQGTGVVNVSAARNTSLVVRVQAPGTESISDYTLAIGQAPRPQANQPLPNRPLPNQPLPNRPLPNRPLPNRPLANRPLLGRTMARQDVGLSTFAPSIRTAPAWTSSLRGATA